MSTLRIAVAQINCVVGDLDHNARLILDVAQRAVEQGAQLLLTPELALCGYPPEDLLLRPDFIRACAAALARLAAEAPAGLALLVGHPHATGEHLYNAASIVRGGRVEATYFKQRLPNYEVFDEQRYFDEGTAPLVVDIAGVKVGVNICADVWKAGAPEAAAAAGAQLLAVLNASPYHVDKPVTREQVLAERVLATGMPAVYCNLVGGQDELVFDGASFALDRLGRLAWRAPHCAEHFATVDFSDGDIVAQPLPPVTPVEQDCYETLVLGVRDYLGKNGFKQALIGLSGGVDSALTLCIAVDAIGAGNVRAVMMPSPYTAQMSLDDSRALVRNLGVRYDEVSIAPAMATFEQMLKPLFGDAAADTTEENVQARARMIVLMALSNKTGAIVLTTGNKSEMAVGYSTLYGDLAGGFAVIKDIYKTFVYRLCAWRNRQRPDIPDNILTRAPSAELRPDQTDQDSLPSYEILDAIIQAYMERDESPREIIAQGFAEADVKRVIGLLKRNEYKRRQAPPGVRVTERGFGKDWRYPITNRYGDDF
ncbi:NAD+ synthase [Methyloversatilis sp.]|uniref:NAD+ synthase n=1 Tax=Methyloversatilis sp. TaxID=2569862 RepID=UPI002735CBEC|nr:NAD+ synthase [Methyloversatilis sp.]MDP2868355.1 NAD+ synthase [Methyloversatilis sp.]MDP3454188.1 NAD+ synthase [Methyloversatilis sp.]MDP3578354.1 NAD+ synthase [Methyloversatilis sp.]